MKYSKLKLITSYGVLLVCLLTLAGCTKNVTKSKKINQNNPGEIIDDKKEVAEKNDTVQEEAQNETSEENNIYLFSGDKDLSNEQKQLFYGEGSLADRINEYLGDEKDDVGFLYYNLNTGEQISFNEDKQFYAASIYKLAMNILYYDMANNGEINLQDEIVAENYSDESDNEYFDSDSYSTPTSLQDLLDQTIINSDNTAASMLYHYLGGWTSFRNKYNSFFNISIEYWTNDTTVNNEFAVIKYLYDNNQNFTHLIDTMKNTSFHDRLDKYIPQNIVAHKIGDLDETANDEGIVFTDKPYIIIVLTENLGYSYETIANISKAAYIYNLKN